MKCEKCGKELNIEDLKARTDRTTPDDEGSMEVGLQCPCGADYATFVATKDLVLMN
ncbi:MAG TPA: hypothetical protein VG347_05120 [Verrucomicrobiae bacterium]|nr:hypothetical protein [Verrucomicrobiae bacterium]